MAHPHEIQRQAEARYRALESGSLLAFVLLVLSAVAANLAYPSSLWFLSASAVGGALAFLSWWASSEGSRTGVVVLSPAGVAVSLLGLLVEIDRPLVVNMVCGFSVFGAVMFGFIAARRRARKRAPGNAA